MSEHSGIIWKKSVLINKNYWFLLRPISQCLHSLITNSSLNDLYQKLFTAWGNRDDISSFLSNLSGFEGRIIPKKSRSEYNQQNWLNLLRISYNYGNNFHVKILSKNNFILFIWITVGVFHFYSHFVKCSRKWGFVWSRLYKFNKRNTSKKVWKS